MTHDWDLLYEIAVEEKENYGDGLDVRKGQPFSLVTLVCILVVWFKFILQNAIVLICV
jgi:hypothetical protein